MRTKLSVCRRKTGFATAQAALAVACGAAVALRPYRCDRCRRFHLTSRTKGKRMPSWRQVDTAEDTRSLRFVPADGQAVAAV